MSTLIDNIVHNHMTEVTKAFSSINKASIEAAAEVILEAIGNGNRIYTAGNGASAAIAQHWACDYTKGCSDLEHGFKPRVISLSANIPLMTAISNDINYDDVYAYQIERLADPGDIFISISSSGNSPTMVRACEAAFINGMTIIALTGFNGGKTRELAHHSIHVDIQEYEATEDMHQAIMHIIAKYIRARSPT